MGESSAASEMVARPSDRGPVAIVAGIVFALAAPAIFAWSWLHPLPGPSDFYALGGRLPWSDGFDYWGAAHHFMQQGRLDEWGSRRPINGASLAGALIFGGNLLVVALAVRSIMLGLALGGLAAVAILRLGVGAGLIFGAVMLVPIAVVQATTQSEVLGALMGIGATAALFVAANERLRLGSAIMGFFLLTLGMAARPGAVLMLPALATGVIAAAWSGARGGRSVVRAVAAALVALAVGVGAGLGVNTGVRMLTADPAIRGNANFAGTLLGIARGTDYYEADRWLRGELGEKSPERDRAELAYRESWRLLARQPLTAAAKLTENLVAFVVRAWPILLLAVIGLIRSPRSERWFWISGWLGILPSVPVVFGDGGVRCLAVSWPFMALAAASALRVRSTGAAAAGDPSSPAGIRRQIVGLTFAVMPSLVALIHAFAAAAVLREGGALWQVPKRGTFKADLSPSAGAEEVDWICNEPLLHSLLIAEESDVASADPRLRTRPWLTPAALASRGAVVEFGEPLERVPTPYLLCVVYDIAQSRARVFTLPADGRTADALAAGAPVLRVDSNRLRDDGRVRVGVLVTPVPLDRLPERNRPPRGAIR